jgi:hypothetical protein
LDVVIGSPEPDVIDNCVASVNLNHLISLYVTRCIGSTNSGKNIAQNNGILLVTRVTGLTNLQKRVCGTGTSLKENSGNSDTVNVCDFNSCSSMGRNESSKTKTEDNGVWVVDLDGFLKMVNSGLENQVESF